MTFTFSNRTSRLRTVAGVLLVAATMLAACGSNGSPSATASTTTTTTSSASVTTTTPATTTATITIHGFNFGPSITVAPGATVTVKNTDPTTHSLSADHGEFDAGSIASETSVTFTAPTRPGTYPFHCNFHANMHGTLIVAR